MDRFGEIEAFVQVAQAGSFTRAAQHLDLAKSVVSDRVARLERRLGVQLLRRTTRRLTLTDPGLGFFARARRVLDDLTEAESEASRAQTVLSGRLRVAAPLSFGIRWLGPLLVRFMHAHPELVVDLDLDDRRVDLVAEGFDVVLRIGRLEDSTLVARRLARIRHIAAATPAFWDTHGRPERPTELMALPVLAYTNSPSTWRVDHPVGAAQHVTLTPRFTANNGDALRDAARTGLGFVVEPTFILHDALSDGELEPVLTDWSWSNVHLYAVWAPTFDLSQRVRTFVDALIDAFAAPEPPWDKALPSPLP